MLLPAIGLVAPFAAVYLHTLLLHESPTRSWMTNTECGLRTISKIAQQDEVFDRSGKIALPLVAK